MTIEETSQMEIDFKKLKKVTNVFEDLIPVVIQHATTKEVLLLAYTNEEAFLITKARKRVMLYSSSRNALWSKGETSGDYLNLVEMRINCEQNSLLYLVDPVKGVCHSKDSKGHTRSTCFYRKIEEDYNLKNESL